MLKLKPISIGNITFSKASPYVLIAGPCVIENYETTKQIASDLKKMTADLGLPFIFKASYDKANRTALNSYRGPGLREGLKILAAVKKELNVPILSDVHHITEIEPASEVLDIIQIPAFLCRQTDLIVEAAKSFKVINIKKGQFIAPWNIEKIVEKVTSTGNKQVIITERGTQFGYNYLVVDFCSIKIMQDLGLPIIFDATHSVQLPGSKGNASGGNRDFAPVLAKAAMAVGVEGLFLEVHPNPLIAKCDGPNSLYIDSLAAHLKIFKEIQNTVNLHEGLSCD